MLKYFYALLFVALCFPSHAGEKCKDTRTLDEFFKEELTKSFYLIDDYQNYLVSMGHKKTYCLPADVIHEDVIKLLVKYYTSAELLNEIPRSNLLEVDVLQPPLGDLIAYVLTKHYPCN